MQYRLMGQTETRFPPSDTAVCASRSGLRIDEGRTERQVLSAIDRGVNYFDTAYIYPGSEGALGRISRRPGGGRFSSPRNCRRPWSRPAGYGAAFDAQLGRLKAECTDYYLMHALTDMSSWERLKNLGVEEFLKGKGGGKIRRVAFSFHGTTRSFKQILTITHGTGPRYNITI